MTVANTLAYYDTATITTVKCFMTQRPWSESKLAFKIQFYDFITSYVG
jgi:hypothetical protein